MDTSVKIAGIPETRTIVCDDTCPVVRVLATLVKNLDQKGAFVVVGKDADRRYDYLIRQLDESPWSLLLVDEYSETWHGPDAIPFILKQLPWGRLAVVAYLIPGTSWLTRQMYYAVSRNRKRLSELTAHSST